MNSPHKGQWRGALMFSLICVGTNGWVNNRDAGDLRRHCAHYDVTVMTVFTFLFWQNGGHISALWYSDTLVIYPKDFVASKLLYYPSVLYSSNICHILLYDRQMVIITFELIRSCSPLGENSSWNRTTPMAWNLFNNSKNRFYHRKTGFTTVKPVLKLKSRF